MKKILCPTDFSEIAHGAIAYAAKLAQVLQAELTLYHVHSAFNVSPVDIIRGEDTALNAKHDQLEAQSAEVTRTFKIHCQAKVETSARPLGQLIGKEAEAHDLVVMGSDGADNLYQFFAGSNTYNAIRNAKTPVLLIPPGYLYSEIKKVVYAFDYLRNRDLPLSGLVPFIQALNCELTVLQVMETAYSGEAEAELEELQFIFKTKYTGNIQIQFDTIRSDETAQSINSYILRNEPDMLVLCSIHRNLLQRVFQKSVIKDITSISNYPIFVFHDTEI